MYKQHFGGCHMKIIGILGAMPEEVDLIVGGMSKTHSEEYAGVLYHFGHRAGKSLVVCYGGMGKANAASTTQVLITKFHVDAIIFSGIAGNMSSEIGIGDVVISKTLCYHDAEDRMLAQSAPGTACYTANPALIDAIEQGCRLTNVHYIIGKVATGDQFVGDAKEKKHIKEKHQPDCVEMEGASVAQIAMRNEIPFVVVRTMSDNSDESIEALGAEEFDISSYVETASAIVLAGIDALKQINR